jgi:hypothetical protein
MIFRKMRGYDINSFRTGYITYLLDHKLNYGFSGFWNSNVITEEFIILRYPQAAIIHDIVLDD